MKYTLKKILTVSMESLSKFSGYKQASHGKMGTSDILHPMLHSNACHMCKSQGGITANVKLHFCSFVGVCKIYEEYLKRMNPNSPSITYDISQLFDFIDQLSDLSCLV